MLYQVPLLEVRKVSKRFPGVLALNHVHLNLLQGEVLALVGENGAGKSTLLRILAGEEIPDSGQIFLEGKVVSIDSVKTASRLGIALIHQELNLSDNLDIGANIFLGREPLRLGLMDRRRIYRESQEVMSRVGLTGSPAELVGSLSIGQQQLVEIARALSLRARILIMDEPTSSLSQRETEQLLQVVRELKAEGVGVLYISHRLGEVKKLADRVLVLRDGMNAGELDSEEIDHDRMVKLMVGRDVSQFYHRIPYRPGRPLLEARNLRSPAHPRHELSFSIQAGEIVGVAGLIGSGRTEMLNLLFGIDRPLAGKIRIQGQPLRLGRPFDAIQAGVALVPEDRKQQGLILTMALRQNLSLAGLRANRLSGGLLNRSHERQIAMEMVERLEIKTPGLDEIVEYLSGGTQQKVVLAKWLALKPKVLLMDEPTRGIDVGAKEEIYRLMEELAEDGVAILFSSSEMEEILGMSHRLLVMHEGRINGELRRDEFSEGAVMQLATGLEKKGLGRLTRTASSRQQRP